MGATKVSALALAALALADIASASAVIQTNLVSDIPGLAAVTDPSLINPWGVGFFEPISPFWVSDNGSGVSTLYDRTGAKQSLTVAVPGAGGSQGAPTGQVYNGGGAFHNDQFIFAGLDGLITGWRPSSAGLRRCWSTTRPWEPCTPESRISIEDRITTCWRRTSTAAASR